MRKAIAIGIALAMVLMTVVVIGGDVVAPGKGKGKGPHPKPLEINAEVYPETLNLESNGRFVTVTIEVSGEDDDGDKKTAEDIVPESVELEGLPRLGPPTTVGDDGNFTAKYDRADLEDILSPADAVTLTVTGEFTDGDTFSDTDTIRVI